MGTKQGLLRALAACACLVLLGVGNPGQAEDIFRGPAPGQAWESWFKTLKAERARVYSAAKIDPKIYDAPAFAWSRRSFRQYFMFMYDRSFVKDGRYRTEEFLAELRNRFGAVDSVLLWQAYPQLGFDRRNQFDFYRDMPGGLKALRSEVVDVLHARGVRVFVDFNPWDAEVDYAQLGWMVRTLNADGVMLDTMSGAPDSLQQAVSQAKDGVVLAPERTPSDEQLSFARQSWAQWSDWGSDDRASVYRIKALLPSHQQFAIRRWDDDRSRDILYTFFQGAGMLLWDDVFGTWNPYSRADRALLAQTGILLEAYADFFAGADWSPLVPTGAEGLDANLWTLKTPQGSRNLWILRNRTNGPLEFHPSSERKNGVWAFFGATGETAFRERSADESISVAARSVELLVEDDSANAVGVFRRFQESARKAAADLGDPEERKTPPPVQLPPPNFQGKPALAADRNMIALPGGSFRRIVEHPKRESGCVPWGTDPYAQWGWYFEDTVHHEDDAAVPPFSIKSTPVTNAEFLEFVHAARYTPQNPRNFLKHIPRNDKGELPATLPPSLASLPVTYVSLNDARAYAASRGERLPTEIEWQWAAEGAGIGNPWPWGRDEKRAEDGRFVNRTGKLAAADAFDAGATPQGVKNLTGNAWELTESEWTDRHTRFVFLRGGVFLPPAKSVWVTPRGPRPNRFHAKYLLLDDSVDRSEAISFRTVLTPPPGADKISR